MGRISEIETRQQQAQVIALLSAGMSRRKACQAVGIGYSTLAAWQTEADFSAALATEVERRQKLIEDTLRAAADEQIKSDAQRLSDDLESYKKAIVDTQLKRIDLGRELAAKAARRLAELPDESLSASDSIRLLQAADAFLERGLTLWGEALAIDGILKKLGVNFDE